MAVAQHTTPVNVEDPGGQASTTCSFTAMKSFRDSQDSLAHVEYVVKNYSETQSSESQNHHHVRLLSPKTGDSLQT